MAGRRNFDCIVLGGGISGAVAARRLAEFGLHVCLLHQDEARAQRAVEFVATGALAIVERLGIGDCIASARHARPVGTSIRWAGEVTELDASAASSLIVDRAALRTALLDKARQCGVEVRRGSPVRQLERRRGGWLAETEPSDGPERIEARLAVFAGGRHGLRCGRRQRMSPATVAVTGRFSRPAASAKTCVEAALDAWYWAAPLAEGGIQVTAFAAPDHPMLSGKCRLEQGFRGLVAASRLLGHLADAPLARALTACDASRTIVQPSIGNDFVAVGDAAFTIDPLSSQGMIKAVVSAEQGAVAANTILRHPDRIGAAKTFHLERAREAVDWDRQVSGRHYARQAAVTASPFWLARAESGAEARHVQADRPIVADLALTFDQAASVGPAFVIRDQTIAEWPALHHPRLARPVAFVGSAPVHALLADMPRTLPAAQLVDRWSAVIGRQAALRFVLLLWNHAVLVPAEAGTRPA